MKKKYYLGAWSHLFKANDVVSKRDIKIPDVLHVYAKMKSFLPKKMRVAFAMQKLLTIRQQKTFLNFMHTVRLNKSLTNDFIKLTNNRAQGPVVQSIVSLTSSLRGQLVKCFTTL